MSNIPPIQMISEVGSTAMDLTCRVYLQVHIFKTIYIYQIPAPSSGYQNPLVSSQHFFIKTQRAEEGERRRSEEQNGSYTSFKTHGQTPTNLPTNLPFQERFLRAPISPLTAMQVTPNMGPIEIGAHLQTV